MGWPRSKERGYTERGYAEGGVACGASGGRPVRCAGTPQGESDVGRSSFPTS